MRIRTVIVVAAIVSGARLAGAQQLRCTSVDPSGIPGNELSAGGALSFDGRFVVFYSSATNLVANDATSLSDVFLRDRTTGITELVSIDSNGAQAIGTSFSGDVSDDGTVVVFESNASNLVAGDTNATSDVFVHDRVSGITERVSVDSSGAQANGGSERPSISGDGRYVAFLSLATNLVASDGNGSEDLFVRDRVAGVTTRVSVATSGGDPDGATMQARISRSGNAVAFSSYASNLVVGDTNGDFDVFIADLAAGTTERVSVDGNGAQGNGNSFVAAPSADASVVAFYSYATNLVPGGTKQPPQVFVRDRTSGTTELVAVNLQGSESDAMSFYPSISYDGSHVAFESTADDLVADATNGMGQVYVRDRKAGSNALASINDAGAIGNDYSYAYGLSGDGSVVVFYSYADNLADGDANRRLDVFVTDLSVPPVLANWSNYGSGWAGTFGVPTFVPRGDPVLGTTAFVDASSSSGTWGVGFLIFGVASASIPTRAGGELLVAPLAFDFIGFAPSGATFSAFLAQDPALAGVTLYAQVIEQDAGASRGISFTQGLELDLGR